MNPTATFSLRPGAAALLLSLALLTAACDSTPRERQEAVARGADRLDSLADKAGASIERAGSRAARFDSASRVRSRQPLDPAAQRGFAQELLGSYAAVDQLAVTDLDPAYTQLLRQTRAKRREWTQRDWDYATTIFKQLNARYRAIRLDLPARNEIHIKALQAEFNALESGRDLKDLGEAVRDKPASAR